MCLKRLFKTDFRSSEAQLARNRLSQFLSSGSVRLSSQDSIHRRVGDSRQAKAETPELVYC